MFNINTQSRGSVSHGVSACPGCGLELIIRNVLDVLGEDVTFVIPPGCSALFCGFGKEAGVKIAAFQGNLENSAAYATGISRGYRMQGNDHTKVVAFAGDGGTLDIGLQSLSGMLERGEDVLYICYDNEAYMNTGIQSSSSTPLGASTTTTPGGKGVHKKDLLGIAMAHQIPYCASASIAYLPDLRKKVEKAKAVRGPSLLHIHCPCPTGWGYETEKSIEVCRKGVLAGAWILYECEDGKITINSKQKKLKPLHDYLSLQKRFRGMTEDQTAQLEQAVARQYEILLKKAE